MGRAASAIAAFELLYEEQGEANWTKNIQYSTVYRANHKT
jgi:hypothetical protein